MFILYHLTLGTGNPFISASKVNNSPSITSILESCFTKQLGAFFKNLFYFSY